MSNESLVSSFFWVCSPSHQWRKKPGSNCSIWTAVWCQLNTTVTGIFCHLWTKGQMPSKQETSIQLRLERVPASFLIFFLSTFFSSKILNLRHPCVQMHKRLWLGCKNLINECFFEVGSQLASSPSPTGGTWEGGWWGGRWPNGLTGCLWKRRGTLDVMADMLKT